MSQVVIYAVRHPPRGKSKDPRKARLTAAGRAQAGSIAKALAERLAGQQPLVLHSGYARTQELAKLVAAGFEVRPRKSDWLSSAWFSASKLAKSYGDEKVIIACAHKSTIETLLLLAQGNQTMRIARGDVFVFILDTETKTVSYDGRMEVDY